MSVSREKKYNNKGKGLTYIFNLSPYFYFIFNGFLYNVHDNSSQKRGGKYDVKRKFSM